MPVKLTPPRSFLRGDRTSRSEAEADLIAMLLPGAAALPPALQLSLLLASNGPSFMDCRAAPLCGVLTLETGLGQGKHRHTVNSALARSNTCGCSLWQPCAQGCLLGPRGESPRRVATAL